MKSKPKKNHKKEHVSSRQLTREFHSEVFLRGLEEAITITHETGRETAFGVEKTMGKKWFVYDSRILIGEKNKVSEEICVILEKKYQEKFERETGKKLDCTKNFENYVDFLIWKEKHGLRTEEPFPDIDTLTDRRKSAVNYHSIYDRNPDLYRIMHFHTHPNSYDKNHAPSFNDLKGLNERRKYNQIETGEPFSPIALHAIVNRNAPLEIVPLVFYQEESPQPLDEESVRAANEVFHILGNQRRDPRRTALLGAKALLGTYLSLWYNWKFAYLDIDKKELTGDFGEFEVGSK
jgi:hypothetical protein